MVASDSQRAREIQAIAGELFISKEDFLFELKNVQDVIFKEIDIRVKSVSGGEQSSTSQLRNEVLMNNSQYKKILELMLDLEKKVDKRFLEAHHETATAIVNAFDIGLVKREMEDQVTNKILDLESKFDQVFSERMNVVEDEMDKTIKSIKDIIDTVATHDSRIQSMEQNAKDAVQIIQKLDSRMVT